MSPIRSLSIVAVLAIAATGAHATTYSFTTITAPDTPLGDSAQALSINDHGQVLVSALNASGGVDVDDLYNIYTHVYTALPSFPGAVAGTSLANGINNAGEIVGQFQPGDGYLQGFSYSGGAFSDVDVPGNPYTAPIAISNNGVITGVTATTGFGSAEGFTDAGGVYQTFAAVPPAGNFTTGEGINDAGTIVGVYGSLSTGEAGSYVDAGGVVLPFAMPGEAFTGAAGINDAGTIVGFVSNDGFATQSGFVDNGVVFSLLNFPGSAVTGAGAINNQGDIVGEYLDGDGDFQAFLAIPVPEPATWTMMLVGFVAMGFAARRRRRRVPSAACFPRM